MGMDRPHRTFASFWPYYVAQHLDPTCRRLHVVGTGLSMLCLLLGLLHSPLWLIVFPVPGYGLAWIGHFFFERNRPAAFGNPVLSFIGDLKMFWLTLRGRMGPEIARAEQIYRS
jgi:hypothetical protein